MTGGAKALDAAIRAAVRRSDRTTTTAAVARDWPAPIPRWLRARFDRARERWRG